jgi:C-terminal processing protease CtpA/Prc
VGRRGRRVTVEELNLARYFPGETTLAWAKRRRNGGKKHTDLTQLERFFVQPAHANAFTKPVFILTSGATFSAGETFILAMRGRKNVRVLGETTSGHFSDIYFQDLPNGWELYYSGEIFLATGGREYPGIGGPTYESTGIPPDVLVPFDQVARQKLLVGKDAMLERALLDLSRL